MPVRSGTPLRIVPSDEWPSLPIQPPAGAYRRWTSRGIYVFFGTLAPFMVGVFVAPNPVPGWFDLLFGALILELVVVGAIALFALRPYYAERRLEYTTWASLAELKSARQAPEDAPHLGR